MFDYRTLRSKVAAQDRNTAVCSQRMVKVADDIRMSYLLADHFALFLQNLVTVLIEAVLLHLLQIFP